MAENHKEEPGVDKDFEKAKQSMAGRVDPDPIPPAEEIPPAPKTEVVTPEPPVIIPPKEDKKPEGMDNVPPVDPSKKVSRPEAFIPLKKYHDEKRDWETLTTNEKRRADEAEARVAELTKLAGQDDSSKKDEDIEAFMAETGFDRSTVDGFLKLAEKRLLGPERLEAIKTSESIVKEANIEAEFAQEMETIGTPELKKRFPAMTDEQLEKAQDYLDKVAHTKAFHDKPLDFVVYKHLDDIEKLFVGESKPNDAVPPQTKKTIEGGRVGAGNPVSVSAKDFEGSNDFSALSDLEPAVRNALIKDFSSKTYENFKSWVKAQEQGVEVTRNGQKVILK